MCGICGAVGFTDPSVLEDMASCISHRGPDSTGSHLGDGVMLANQRLSIIDLKGGDQPIYNEDGDVVVVYNGEIYNFAGLRDELKVEGHEFSTESDTEVLVHGYEEWGTGVFGRLNGMFAVALWDATKGKLLLARDRAGIKPLYYASVEEGVIFGSEPKSVLKSGLVQPGVDTDALRYFLQMRYSPSRTSLFEGVRSVLPGTYLEIKEGEDDWKVEEKVYWEASMAHGETPDNPVRVVRRALRNAVERQLVSDVPVGFYLSGGLDTSSVVAMASQATEEPIHTFCMGFSSDEWDEREDARVVADHFDTVHHEIELDRDFMNDYPDMIWYADEPKRNLYPYYVAQEMRDHVKVALGGLGSDELFGGYVYRYNRLEQMDDLRNNLPRTTRNALGRTADTLYKYQLEAGDIRNDGVFEELSCLRNLEDSAELYVVLNSSDVVGDLGVYRERVFGGVLDGEGPAEVVRRRLPETRDSLREQALDWDFATKMVDDFLLVEDRMSMAHSLESRVPFLDNELIDVAFSLPLESKFGTGRENVGKAVLREAMKDLLPRRVFEKEKQGFTMPAYRFAKNELLPHAQNILDDPYITEQGFVQGDYVNNLLERKPVRDLTPHYKMLWKLVGLEIWYQMYFVGGLEGPEEIESYYT